MTSASHKSKPAPEGAALLTTGEMARASKNTLRTVRFYEEAGILRPTKRTDGGHRLFHPDELQRLCLVTDMRAAGLSLDEIKAILALKQARSTGGEAAQDAVRRLAVRIEELESKLRVLTRLVQDFSETSDIMGGCMTCQDPRFPNECDGCTVMTSPPKLPRSLRVLWSGRTGTSVCPEDES